ncbi:PfkB family carbohydrate kinase [Pseudomonadota bacterium]|nr:PfkB family carbohydrate kinase [Pseudomonadota bacterium]
MKNKTKKIFFLEDLKIDFNSENAKIVLCYGHFNVLHPGHFRYFDYARNFGDKLYIILQGDMEIDQNIREHYFSEKQRAEALEEIEKIDGIICYNNNLIETIKLLKADFLVLGKEHENSNSKNISQAVEGFKNLGGTVVFHAGDITYANIDLLPKKEEKIKEQKKKNLSDVLKRQNIKKETLINIVDKFNNANLLVIGDTIIDEYISCDALGMSAEAPLVVFRELGSKNYIGGAAVVASHIKSLGANCKYISIIGDDDKGKIACNFLDKLNIENIILIDKTRPTTFKTRYMVNNQKIFRVSRLKDHSIPKSIEQKLIKQITNIASKFNGILISDFVYGMITPNIIEAISKISKRYKIPVFADLQCSSQYGNILKFEDFELLCPNEREARIALGNNDDSIERIAQQILNKTKSKKLILKLGLDGFVSYDVKSDQFIEREHFPALTVNPVDVAGAGDSLLSALSVCLAVGSNFMQASAIATYMASLSVQTIGNNPINKDQLKEAILK